MSLTSPAMNIFTEAPCSSVVNCRATIKTIRSCVPVALLLAVLLSSATVCHASRGGSSGQDLLLAPSGEDTKASAADDVKQDGKQKGGGGGGGGGGGDAGGGGTGYPWKMSNLSTSFAAEGGANPPSTFESGRSPTFAAGEASSRRSFSGSSDSGAGNDSPGFEGTGSGVYGSYGGTNYPNYSSKSSAPLGQQPMHPQRGPAPQGHPRDATRAGLPPCCTESLPCCGSNWPCCQKAQYHGYTPPGAPNQLPYSQNIQGPDRSFQQQGQNQNQQGQNNNNNNNNNNQNQNQTQNVNTPAISEGKPGAGPMANGLSSSQAAATNQLMGASGMNGQAGGKMASAAGLGLTGLMSMFTKMAGQQSPGANKEQQKSNAMAEKSQVADNLAGMEREQAATAIQFVLSFLQNFTTSGKYLGLHDSVFIPIAVLLLLPGAVLAQTKSIVAQGIAVLGEVNPWEGILRSIVAVFLIMSSGLIMNYSIDVANALVQAVSQGYNQNFGSSMGSDAMALHVRAHPIRLLEENYITIPDIECVMFNYFGNTPAASMEGQLLAVKYEDPRAGLYIVPPDRAPETVPYKVPFAREAFNEINCGLAFGWVILCAIQVCYLYYLYFMGPVLAALWVYPSQLLRQAFPSWIEGVVCLCFWSFFWATTVCLMACFRGVDDTGTVACTALLSLALLSAKSAFDFVGLVKEAAREAEKVAEKVGHALLEAKAAKAKGG